MRRQVGDFGRALQRGGCPGRDMHLDAGMNPSRLTNYRLDLCRDDARPLDVAILSSIIDFPSYVVIPACILFRCTCDCGHPVWAISGIAHVWTRRLNQFSRSPVSTSNKWTRSGSGDRKIG